MPETGSLIPREYNGVEIAQRRSDRYINATAMCQAGGKEWKHYRENAATTAFLQALSDSVGIPTESLVESRGGRKGGTWIHPQVAIHLAQWISPAFAVKVTEWVLDLLTTGTVSIGDVPVAHPILPRAWSERLSRSFEAHHRFIMSRCPGWWSILTAISTPMLLVEDCVLDHLLPLQERDLPDVSASYFWNRLRRERDWPAVERFAPLELPGKKFPVQVNLYRPQERAAFEAFFYNDYVPNHMPEYLRKKFQSQFGRLPPLSAAEAACQRIVGRSACLEDRDRRALAERGGTVRAVAALPC